MSYITSPHTKRSDDRSVRQEMKQMKKHSHNHAELHTIAHNKRTNIKGMIKEISCISRNILVLLITVMQFIVFALCISALYSPCEDKAVEQKEEKAPAPYEIQSRCIDVPYIDQREGYPNGCEAVSAVMLLRYRGIDISVDDFVDIYLDRTDTIPDPGGVGPDPDKVYMGDPRSAHGWGCNSTVIVNAMNKIPGLSRYTISCFYGKSLEDLCTQYIDSGIPVMIWATLDMRNACDSHSYHHWVTDEGKEISYNRYLHCLVLCGYDEEYYYFNDPLRQKKMPYPKAECDRAYDIMGRQSIVITL